MKKLLAIITILGITLSCAIAETTTYRLPQYPLYNEVRAGVAGEPSITFINGSPVFAQDPTTTSKVTVVSQNNPGVPASADQQTSSSRTYTTRKGELNHYRLRPRILGEHVETARGAQANVTSSQIVGQIFKASCDNINGIFLTLESAAGTVIDDFESYANSAELQVVWIETDAADPAALATVIVGTGTKSMLLPMGATVNDEWYKVVTATDYTGYTFSMQWRQSRTYAQAKMYFYIEDSAGNSKFLPLVVDAANSFEDFDLQESAMVESAGNTLDTDTTDIVRVGFRLADSQAATDGYADQIIATPEPGVVGLELWDMGATIPTSGATSLSDGNKYEELGDRGINGGTVSTNVILELVGGKRFYDVYEYIAGTAEEIPSNTKITNNNYYAIVLRYIDTDVTVYGANTNYVTQYYNSGYAFTTPDEATAITQIGTYNDICFGVFCAKTAYLNTLITQYATSDDSLASPGADAVEIVNIEDKNMVITDYLVGATRPRGVVEAEFKDTRPTIPKGGKFEVNHTDDSGDNVANVTVFIGYLYEPIETNN
jgi:hypothetical protein